MLTCEGEPCGGLPRGRALWQAMAATGSTMLPCGVPSRALVFSLYGAQRVESWRGA